MTTAPQSDTSRYAVRPPPLGAPVLGRFTKWGGGRHWEWVGRYLGSDEFGDWWFAPPGTRCTRPGVDLVEEVGWVSLVPRRAGLGGELLSRPEGTSPSTST